MGSAMMGQITDKLRDRGGVTILMALFALLVAAMVSMVILGAAVTTVKQAKGSQEHEQNTLALQSAGNLIAENICDPDKTWCTETKMQVTHFEDGTETSADAPTYSVSFSSACLIEDKLKAAMETVLDGARSGSNAAGSGDFTITASLGQGVDKEYEQTVNVHFDCYGKLQQESSVIVDNQLVFTLSLLAEDNTVAQSLYLKIYRAEPEQSSSYDPPAINNNYTGERTVTSITKYTWYNPTFYVAEGVVQ